MRIRLNRPKRITGTRICRRCGKEFNVVFSERIFCSRKCRAIQDYKAYIKDRCVVDVVTKCWLWNRRKNQNGYGEAGLRNAPEKLGGMEPNPYYAKWLESKRGQNPYTLEYVAPELPVYCNDTNADSMSIETSVTCQRLLSFEFEKRKFSETLTNEPWMHYSVEMQRVRTNDIVWLRAWEFGEHKELSVADFRGMLPAVKGGGLVYGFQYPTNYFIPVKTNELPLVSPVLVSYATNSIYPLSEGVTNFHWLWISTNTTNTTK